MKLINTEAQVALQEVLAKLADHPGLSIAEKAELKYWAIELKPKRVRKPSVVMANEKEENV